MSKICQECLIDTPLCEFEDNSIFCIICNVDILNEKINKISLNDNHILNNELVIKWILVDKYFLNINRKDEFKFGNDINKKYFNAKKDTNQWTTYFSEHLVFEILKKNNENPRRPKKINSLLPDWETNNYIYEVKSRSYSTTGTIGEKILGVPYKYSDIPILYKKPLRIILFGYQEYEAINKFNLFNPKSENKKKIINL